MIIKKHGMSIGLERMGAELFLSLTMVGKLSHEDYQTITPMINSALEGIKDPHIKVFCNITELEGWETRAAWDDFKLGLKHGNKFSKVAVVGNKKWQEYCAKVGSWFISGEVKYFEDTQEALMWLNE